MKSRSGELSFEYIVYLSFIAIIVATIVAITQFYLSRNTAQQADTDITVAYSLLLQQIKEDTRIGHKYEIKPAGVSIIDDNNQVIATYELKNKTLYRLGKNKKSEIFVNNLDKASFKLHHKMRNLLLVTLLPQDKKQLPFFTSFALRGELNEK